MWTLEGRLDEIEIPTRTSTIYELELTEIETKPRQEVAAIALQKINRIPEVTDPRKALGADFRRKDVRADWQDIATNYELPPEYTIAHFRCAASSGAYMRTLATIIAEKCGTTGLAFHIHRTKIGHYNKEKQEWGELL
jgi:tRNA U55 pseudouridine synthase TruB